MPTRRSSRPRPALVLVFERTMALAASVNLALVVFDLTYVPLRNFWLQGNIQIRDFRIQVPLPPITQIYDPIKGISPHRDTQNYLQTLSRLENQVVTTGLSSAPAEELLAEMRNLSMTMINENPFQLAEKTGTLERIKNRMRDHMKIETSKEAFQTFFSTEHLANAGWNQEIQFFNQRIRPLIETNFFRQIGENGQFIERFWLIDAPFVFLFGFEYLLRTFLIRRRYKSLSWREAALWRWYDVLLLIPFWRWLRAIPVTIRLRDAELLDLEPVRAQFSRGFIASFAEELTEMIVVQVISQLQGSIERGDIARRLLPNHSSGYIDINNVNEIQVIITHVARLIIYQILPSIRPDLEALLNYSLESGLRGSAAYQGIQSLPGVASLSKQLTQQISTQVTQALTEIAQGTYKALTTEDQQFIALAEQLSKHFGETLESAIQKKETIQDIQSLVSDLLEEVKINYVRRLSEEDFDQILEETQQITRRQLPTSEKNA